MYICLKCHNISTHLSGKCCGVKVELFDPQKHGELLIGKSNAWIPVWERWENDPLLQETSSELSNDGCYSASTVVNEFIQKLKGQIDGLESLLYNR